MTQRFRLLVIFLILAGYVPVSAAETDQTQNLDSAFQAAVSQYDSGHYAEAAQQLEELVRQVPQSFDVHELLGMVYAAESQESKANDHLAKAVRLPSPLQTTPLQMTLRATPQGPAHPAESSLPGSL